GRSAAARRRSARANIRIEPTMMAAPASARYLFWVNPKTTTARPTTNATTASRMRLARCARNDDPTCWANLGSSSSRRRSISARMRCSCSDSGMARSARDETKGSGTRVYRCPVDANNSRRHDPGGAGRGGRGGAPRMRLGCARPRHRPADPVRKGPAPVTHAPETTVPAPTPLDREGLRGRIDAALGDLLDRGLDGLGFLDEVLEPVAAALRAFVLAGGKRRAPAFVYW